jgi:sentrin-specific protease 1
VKRWTKKIDIFALNKIFIPVNITNTHWGLVLIDIVLKTIIYFDSFRHSGPYASAALQVNTLTILVVLF